MTHPVTLASGHEIAVRTLCAILGIMIGFALGLLSHKKES